MLVSYGLTCLRCSELLIVVSYKLSVPAMLNVIYIALFDVFNGAVTYKWIKVIDAERTENLQKCLSGDGSCLSGGECRRVNRKECIRTEQVVDKEQPANVRVSDV